MTPSAVACAACLAAVVLPWWADGRRARLMSLRARPRTPAASPAVAPPVDVVAVLRLLDAAIGSGASLPRALAAVGRAVGGPDGAALVRASSALVLGAAWATAWADAPPPAARVADALAGTWTTGAAPGPALRTAAETLARERRTVAREAAGRLAVRLVLPLGLCFLPAFVLIGLVPVLISVGSQVAR